MNMRVRTPVLMVAVSVLLLSSALAETSPTPTTTFIQSSSTAWTTAGNWDLGLPDAADDAWIGAGKTGVVTSAALDAAPFGTLTLGAGSTLQLSAATASGLPANSHAYFENGSTLEYTAGTQNRANNLHIVAGATASYKLRDNSIPQGTWSGDGNLFNVIIGGVTHLRATVTFAGDVTFSPNVAGAARNVNITSFGTAPIVGPGVTTYNNGVYAVLQANNRVHDSATVKLFGGAGGGANIKYSHDVDKSDTIANLIIDSPTASTGPYLRMRNGWLKVTNSVSFEGTADTVEIDNNMWPSIYNAGLDARGADITFGGTGSWAVTGDGQLYLNSSSTISNTTDVTLSNIVRYDSGTLNKYGDGTLTLDVNNFTNLFNASIISINAGHVVFASAGLASVPTLTYVSCEAVDTSFTAAYDGSFSTIADVEAAIGDTGTFRLASGVPAGLWEYDNGDGTFSVATGRIIVNRDPTGILGTSATLNGGLAALGTNYTVSVHWGTTDKTNELGAWDDSMIVGSWTNVTRTNVSYAVTNLSPSTTYYFTYLATNDTTNIWASPSLSFTTLDTPVVNNSTGATPINATSATLRGELTGGTLASVWICWGTNDAGIASTGAWDNVEAIGFVSNGVVFSTNVAGLATNQSYWYRCYASNGIGSRWSDESMAFSGSTVVGDGEGMNFRIATTNGSQGVSGLVKFDTGGSFGGANFIVKNLGATSSFTRKGYVRFDLSGIDVTLSDASLELDIDVYNLTADTTINVYGITNQVLDSALLTNGLPWAAAAANDTNSGYAADLTKAEFLGSFTVSFTTNSVGDTMRLKSVALLDFLNADTNDVVTFILGATGNTANNLSFAGDTNASNAPPTLALQGISIIANAAPTNITANSASLNATLTTGSTNYTVYVHWGASNVGTNFGWQNDGIEVGSYTNVSSANISYTASLAADTLYYYTFRASNDTCNVWATPSWSFTTAAASSLGRGSVFRFR